MLLAGRLKKSMLPSHAMLLDDLARKEAKTRDMCHTWWCDDRVKKRLGLRLFLSPSRVGQ